METSWYILSTIVILAVLIDGSHGLSCYNCTNIADITSCKQVIQCNTDEKNIKNAKLVDLDCGKKKKKQDLFIGDYFGLRQRFCYTQTTGNVGDQTRFTQGCRQKQICRYPVLATQPSPSIVGHDVASQVDCNECCGIDNCNSHLCKTGSQALNQAKCVDDPEFDCQQFDGFLHLCSDITHAKQKCQRYCGLCTIVDGSWSSWQSWSSCDRTCGNGTQTRTRACDNPAPQDGGLSCPNVDHEINVCVLGKCPVHGGWATWSSWGSCSATCGIGLQKRDRSCSHPYPGPDGNSCFGDSRDDRACFDVACADGLWSVWSSWGSCSASCLGGMSTRTRTCNNPIPSQFGHDCVGNSKDTKICNTHYCQAVRNGGWSSWSTWTQCPVTFGDKTRNRSCTNPQPSGFGRACSGNDWQTQQCAVLRLVQGTSSHNGRVEIRVNNQWGTVCDDAFTDMAAKVVCRSLGLPTTITTKYQAAHYGQGTGSIWLTYVKCTGTEHSILDCPHYYTGSSLSKTHCNHAEDVGVSCA